MRGFLIFLMILGLFLTMTGGILWLGVMEQSQSAPAIVIVPQLIATELVFLLGLLLTAVSGGLATIIGQLEKLRIELRIDQKMTPFEDTV